MKYKNFLRDMEFTYGVKLGVGDLSSLYSYSNLSSTAFRRLNTYDKIALIVDFLERFDYSKRAAKASKDIIADARKTIDMLVRYGSLSPEKSEERKP